MGQTDRSDFDRLDALAAAALRARQSERDGPRDGWRPRRAARLLPRLVLGGTAWWVLGLQALAHLG